MNRKNWYCQQNLFTVREKLAVTETDYRKVSVEMDGISQILRRSVKETATAN